MKNPTITTTKETPETIQVRDLFRTPKYAVDILIPYIPKDIELVWECAAGERHISRVLEENGYNVFSSDIDGRTNPLNFITDLPTGELLDHPVNKVAIITNPPYSLKRKFVEKCIEYDCPFALLIPADYCGWLIDAIRYYNLEQLVPTRRINYFTPVKRTIGSSDFHSMWLTRYFDLGKQQVFVDLTPEKRKEIY